VHLAELADACGDKVYAVSAVSGEGTVEILRALLACMGELHREGETVEQAQEGGWQP
jgi:hypothetical protein